MASAQKSQNKWKNFVEKSGLISDFKYDKFLLDHSEVW